MPTPPANETDTEKIARLEIALATSLTPNAELAKVVEELRHQLEE